jgi:hypothetical protein
VFWVEGRSDHLLRIPHPPFEGVFALPQEEVPFNPLNIFMHTKIYTEEKVGRQRRPCSGTARQRLHEFNGTRPERNNPATHLHLPEPDPWSRADARRIPVWPMDDRREAGSRDKDLHSTTARERDFAPAIGWSLELQRRAESGLLRQRPPLHYRQSLTYRRLAAPPPTARAPTTGGIARVSARWLIHRDNTRARSDAMRVGTDSRRI